MLVFWIVASVITGFTLFLLVRPLFQSERANLDQQKYPYKNHRIGDTNVDFGEQRLSTYDHSRARTPPVSVIPEVSFPVAKGQ